MVTTATELEQRCWPGGELRAESTGSVRRLSGYAALYDSPARFGDNFMEVVRRGAFADALKPGADVRAFWSHDPAMPLGRTVNGTLVLRDDAKGLAVEIALPDTSWARDAWESIKVGNVTGMSFGFTVPRDGARLTEENGVLVRELLRVTLIEVSPVSIPAYADTEVVARSRPVSHTNNIPAARLRLRLLDLQARAVGIIDF